MSDTEKDPKDPSSTSDAYDTMAPRWELMNALLGGTETMRAAGEKYMPRHERETSERHAERIKTAVLLNMVDQTLKTLVGKPFSVPLALSESIPEDVVAMLDDIDLQGNRLDIFAREWFREGMGKAFCHVLVEFPRKPEDVQTKEQERAANLRPYWVLVKPESLIYSRFVTINGAEVPVHVRMVETYTETDGFIDVVKQRIRVMEPGKVWFETPVEDKETGKIKWEKGEEFLTDMPMIPLVTFYANREGFMLGKPPLTDLAHLNVTHWQSSSDQRNILTVARFPILACSGSGAPDKDEDDIEIGPNKVLYVTDPSGKYYYVEHAGQAIEAGRKDLQDLEAQMAGYGAQFLKKRPGTETATAAAIDSAEATSDLQAMVQGFQDAVAQALYFTAQWLKQEPAHPWTVEVNTDWSEGEELPAKDAITALAEARDKKQISRKAYVQALIDFGVIPETYDPDEDAGQLAKEAWSNLTPQDLQQVLALQQGKLMAKSEARNVLRKANLPLLSDEAAAEEIDSQLDYGPGVVGATMVPPNLNQDQKQHVDQQQHAEQPQGGHPQQ